MCAEQHEIATQYSFAIHNVDAVSIVHGGKTSPINICPFAAEGMQPTRRIAIPVWRAEAAERTSARVVPEMCVLEIGTLWISLQERIDEQTDVSSLCRAHHNLLRIGGVLPIRRL